MKTFLGWLAGSLGGLMVGFTLCAWAMTPSKETEDSVNKATEAWE